MSRQIFRKVALERLSSPDQLDQLMKITTPSGWLALAALISLLGMALAWAVFGAVPTQVSGTTIFIKTGGIKNVDSPYVGQVSDLAVSAGDIVQQGQIIATVVEPDQGGEKQVTSPYTGRVLEVKVDQGYLVDRGTTLLNMELTGDDVKLEAVMYLPLADGKKIQPGMDVQLSPSTVRQEAYGFMLGKVASVGTFPSTYQGILRTLGSDDLVQALNIGVAPIEVHVELTPDPATTSGYRWSSPEGPPTTVESGTLGTATVITGRQRPINYILPSG
ncbi:MAG: NHLP bacteriocin system secretion protein [Chloroflexi bacterium]|nr:NHLP bacteriocin system secretion protein [Chloroflexota bacterium]MCI0576020.1 NHLP bacteriocin system secretion protein [Chloroflexota bacterium]MCI0645144.1 NHLP bacteriocin system secretion protein [Chloroflexota bacterium]MCI0725624.1 NHLP bacteriocin system secretion protein [Chloroflexota bacterium]